MDDGVSLEMTLLIMLLCAVILPLATYVGIKLNVKGLRTDFRDLAEDWRFYAGMALAGTIAVGALSSAINVFEACGIDAPWNRLLAMPTVLLPIMVITWVLRRLRSATTNDHSGSR